MAPHSKLAVLLGLCSLAGACATGKTAFGPTGYEQLDFHYQIAYTQPTNQRVLRGEWRLDNLTYDDRANEFVHKKGPDYRWTREEDTDGDGTISRNERYEEGIYDLKYVNARDRGVIWTKAHPLLLNRAGQDLDVILESYADQLSGEGLYAAGTVFSAETVKARKYVSFLVERAPIQIGPNLGVSAIIELAESERLRLDPNHRSTRLKIVLTKMAFRNPEGTGQGLDGIQAETVRCGTSICRQGIALLVVGYYNDASHFGEHVAEFDDFVKRLSVPPEGAMPDRWRSRPVKAMTAAAPAAAPATPAAAAP
jgi:hypothetical protein